MMQTNGDLQERFPRYSTVNCTVTAHRSYGLIVAVEGDGPGFVDLGYISQIPVTTDAWPRVGEERRGVVLGVTNDGRLRLDIRDDDLALADRAVNLAEAMSRWSEARHAEPADTGARQRFYQSADTALLLAWLVRGKGRGSPMESLWALVGDAPEDVRRSVVATLTQDAFSGDQDAVDVLTALYRACGMALSTEVLRQMLIQQPPSAERLAMLAQAVADQPVIDSLRTWAMNSPDQEIRNVGERMPQRSSGEGGQ
ncbi:hypothetical protein [Streptomyces sp. BSE7-9]|uniref:hypothetical protein n=1 Tax=Streptomyces sp. BSE7-9 TaxID=2759948 RepID=UPI000FE27694|nr:hypothetical protein [Streptomyces sp. BSE7-9]MBJ6644731.1 hypothetical protein [Streptomyces sp. BSE7-9]